MMCNSYSNICGCSSLKAFDFPGIEPLIHNDSFSNPEDDVFVSRYFENLNGFIDDMQPSESLETNPLLEVDDRITSALRKRGLVLRYPSVEDNKQLGEVLTLATGGDVSDYVWLKIYRGLIEIAFLDVCENASKIWFKPQYTCENDVDVLCELQGCAKVENEFFRCIVLENINSAQIEGAVYYSIDKSKQAFKSTGEILLFAVREESQKQGYGNIILTSALEDISKHNCREVKLNSTYDPGALAIYLKFGFLPNINDQEKLEWKKLNLLEKVRMTKEIGPALTLDFSDPQIKENLQVRENLIFKHALRDNSKQANSA